ncbi:MAG: thermonuclease family protein [Acidobacteria bacterium]|nr:thermonuclease family protein [Acidobacteriota bacterium]
MSRWIALTLALVLVADCGPSKRPKFNIKRAADYEPVVPTATTAPTTSATPASDVTIVEIGAFKGSCEHSFSGINATDVVALANPSGLRSYRLAGIAIPPEIRANAHAQIRSWLEGEAVGLEIEGASPGIDPAAYLYRCSTKTMLNAELVRAGLAVVSDSPSAHRDALNKASMEALSARRGVWGSSGK